MSWHLDVPEREIKNAAVVLLLGLGLTLAACSNGSASPPPTPIETRVGAPATAPSLLAPTPSPIPTPSPTPTSQPSTPSPTSSPTHSATAPSPKPPPTPSPVSMAPTPSPVPTPSPTPTSPPSTSSPTPSPTQSPVARTPGPSVTLSPVPTPVPTTPTPVPTPTLTPTPRPTPSSNQLDPGMQYTTFLVVPVQFPAGEPVPLKLGVRNASGIRIDFPTDFTYGFVVTRLDGILVWSWLQETEVPTPVSLPPNGIPLYGTALFDEVRWDQRCGQLQGGSVTCQGQPAPPGTYLVWGFVPPAAGEFNGARALLNSAPDTLSAAGWVVTEPQELTRGGPRLSCSEEIATHRDIHLEVLSDVKRRHEEFFLAIPGLSTVGVGFVREDGERTGELGIVVFVDATQLPEGVEPQDLVPTSLEGCVVNTREGRFVPL